MTKKDNKNIAYKLGAEEFDYLTWEESKKLYDDGWRFFSASYDRFGNKNSLLIIKENGKEKEFKYIASPSCCCF